MTPTPSATGAQVHRWRRYKRFAAWRLGREDSTWGKAVGPHAKAGDDGASGPMRSRGLFSLGSGWGRGFWRVTSSPEDEGRKLPVSLERTGSSWGHVHMTGEDKDSAGRPQCGAAGGRRGLPGGEGRAAPKRGGAGVSLCEKSHFPTLLPCHTSHPSPASRPRPALPFARWGPGERCPRVHPLGAARETVIKGQKERPQALLCKARACLGPLPIPAGDGGRGGGGRCQEHFQTHTARVPPKYRYRRFFTSCVISNPKPSPMTTCQEEPNFLSIVSLIILAALWNKGDAHQMGKAGGWGTSQPPPPPGKPKSWREKSLHPTLLPPARGWDTGTEEQTLPHQSRRHWRGWSSRPWSEEGALGRRPGSAVQCPCPGSAPRGCGRDYAVGTKRGNARQHSARRVRSSSLRGGVKFVSREQKGFSLMGPGNFWKGSWTASLSYGNSPHSFLCWLFQEASSEKRPREGQRTQPLRGSPCQALGPRHLSTHVLVAPRWGGSISLPVTD